MSANMLPEESNDESEMTVVLDREIKPNYNDYLSVI